MLSLSTRQEIASQCTLHCLTSPFRQCFVFESYFVKYGSGSSLKFECNTQEYIYAVAVKDPSAPRVAKVVDYFVGEHMAILVTELIKDVLPADQQYEEVASALQWLRNIPTPAGAKIGSVGGGKARHRIFKDYRAPLLFSSAQALQNYMNHALRFTPKGKTTPQAQMDFLNDKLVFVQSDIHEGNFGIDNSGKICLFDFGDVSILPESFASYIINASSDPFVIGVAQYLDWPPSSNQTPMGRARGILWMISDRTLGLDVDGIPKVKPKHRISKNKEVKISVPAPS